jgi:pSer/pThr/pTyr-binding forkhead associated (FHA) protein
MIICSNCKHNEIEGALFCSECGSQLIDQTRDATQSFPKASLETELNQELTTGRSNNITFTAAKGVQVMMLNFLDSGKMLTLSGKPEYTLGRVSEGQPILPDLDLAPYDAFALGVSRIHAALRIINGRLLVVDLGSVNGTRINGQKLVSKVEYPVSKGDIIALGKLRIQVTLNK